jgi:hypothetical protein
MTDSSGWHRQNQEVMSYNVFFSALTPRATPCLSELGFELPVMFPTITDDRQGVKTEPDFLLYDGDICLLVEVKSGDNINRQHIEQMRACDQVTIETLQEYLKDTEVYEKTSYTGNVDTIETAVVYGDLDEEYIRKCREEWPDCRERLETVEEYAAVLGQERGGSLRLLAGEFETETLGSVFSNGVNLPQNPPREFALTENCEPESLAVAICNIWGQRAVKGPVEVTVSDIRDHFAPRHAVRFGQAEYALTFLEDIGACDVEDDDREIDEGEYEQATYVFTVDHVDEILNIEQTVRETTISDYFREDEQSGLDDF